MSGLVPGEVAWRVTGGHYKGRLVWLNEDNMLKADDNVPFPVQLVTENVPYYGVWGGSNVAVKPKHLMKVWTVIKWSDEV